MATKKAPAKKKAAAKKPELVFEEGYWWIISGTTRVNAGRNERYAATLLQSGSWK